MGQKEVALWGIVWVFLMDSANYYYYFYLFFFNFTFAKYQNCRTKNPNITAKSVPFVGRRICTNGFGRKKKKKIMMNFDLLKWNRGGKKWKRLKSSWVCTGSPGTESGLLHVTLFSTIRTARKDLQKKSENATFYFLRNVGLVFLVNLCFLNVWKKQGWIFESNSMCCHAKVTFVCYFFGVLEMQWLFLFLWSFHLYILTHLNDIDLFLVF